MKKYLVTGRHGIYRVIGVNICLNINKVYGIDIYNSYPKLHEYDNFIFFKIQFYVNKRIYK